MQKRTWADFESHFAAAGLDDLVQYNKKKLYELHCQVSRPLADGGGAGASIHCLGTGVALVVCVWLHLPAGVIPWRLCGPSRHPTITPAAPSPVLSPGPQVLAETVQQLVADDPPASATAMVTEVKAKKEEWGLEDIDVAKVGGSLGFHSRRCVQTACQWLDSQEGDWIGRWGPVARGNGPM